MALFFDQDWFDAKLAALALTRDDVAAALRLMRSEVDEIWKDQREVSRGDVVMLARLLKTSADEIVTRAGISTPSPQTGFAGGDASVVLARLDDMDQRLVRIERAIAALQSMVTATRPPD